MRRASVSPGSAAQVNPYVRPTSDVSPAGLWHFARLVPGNPSQSINLPNFLTITVYAVCPTSYSDLPSGQPMTRARQLTVTVVPMPRLRLITPWASGLRSAKP
jgi:hypothetical protein